MTRDRGRLLLALSWVLAAAAGFLAAWMTRPGPETVVVRDGAPKGATALPPAASSPAAAAPAGRGSSPSTAPPTPPGELPRGIPEEPALPPGTPPAPASVRITVLTAEGTPAEGGTVYALSPGEKGSDDEGDLCSADLEEGGVATLRLPGPGVYDLGATGSDGRALAPDVPVAPGEGTTVTLRLAGDAAVHVKCDPPWPPPGEGVSLQVELWTDDPGEVSFPGRGEQGGVGASVTVGPDGTGASGLLPSGRTFTVAATVFELQPTYFGPDERSRRTLTWQNSFRYDAVPDRATVRPGETVRVRVKPVAPILVEPTSEGWAAAAEARGETVLNLRLRLLQGKVETWGVLALAVKHPEGQARPRFGFRGSAGPARLEWSGIGIRAGSRDDLVLQAGEVQEVAIPLRSDPEGREFSFPVLQGSPPAAPDEAGAPALPVAVLGLPPETTARVYSLDPESGDYEALDAEAPADGSAPAVEFDGEARAARTLWACTYDGSLVSAPVRAPATGGLELPLRPAGWLLVAPTEVFSPEFGRLSLRSADGGPVPISTISEGVLETHHVGRESAAWAGAFVGPLPAGTYTFQVRLGRIRLPDATATVKAGAIEVLRIRR